MFLGIVSTFTAFGFINHDVKTFIADKATFGVALSIAIIWLISILLMAINRPVIRLLEGYGKLNPFRMLLPSNKIF
jgi:hypothetical protein